jgi:hypothetical protein
MPPIHDTPPAAIQNDLDNLAQALHTKIPAKTETNLLIATWNIRRFGSLTRKWTAGDNDSPKKGSARAQGDLAFVRTEALN